MQKYKDITADGAVGNITTGATWEAIYKMLADMDGVNKLELKAIQLEYINPAEEISISMNPPPVTVNTKTSVYAKSTNAKRIKISVSGPQSEDCTFNVNSNDGDSILGDFTPKKTGIYTLTVTANEGGISEKKKTLTITVVKQGTGNPVQTGTGIIRSITISKEPPEGQTTREPDVLTEADIVMTNGKPYVDLYDATFCFNGSVVVLHQDVIIRGNFVKRVPDANGDIISLQFYLNEGVVRDSFNNVLNIGFTTITYSNGTKGVRADLLAIANCIGYGNKITRKDTSDESIMYSIDATSQPFEVNTLAANIVSIGLSFYPGVGDAKDVTEAVSGVDIITGEALSPSDRVLTVVCVFLPVVNGQAVRLTKKGFTKIDNVLNVANRLDNVSLKAVAEGWAEAMPLSLKLLGQGDNLVKYASKVKPISGYTDVIVHGSQDAFWVLHNGVEVAIDQRALATYLKNAGFGGGPIRLISCNTGKLAGGIAQDLSNKLGVEVIAPDAFVHLWNDGALTLGNVIDDATILIGNWHKYLPGNVYGGIVGGAEKYVSTYIKNFLNSLQ